MTGLIEEIEMGIGIGILVELVEEGTIGILGIREEGRTGGTSPLLRRGEGGITSEEGILLLIRERGRLTTVGMRGIRRGSRRRRR